jgi:hypothetical protein
MKFEKLPNDTFNVLYEMLNDISFPKRGVKSNRRNFPLHHSAITFGITKRRFSNEIGLSAFSERYPEIFEEIVRIGDEIIKVPFSFTSIHVNKNVVCPPHLDSSNIGNSVIVSFGEYTGCNLVIENEIFETKNQPVMFNGSTQTHWNTNDLVGTRYSLVFYTNGSK